MEKEKNETDERNGPQENRQGSLFDDIASAADNTRELVKKAKKRTRQIRLAIRTTQAVARVVTSNPYAIAIVAAALILLLVILILFRPSGISFDGQLLPSPPETGTGETPSETLPAEIQGFTYSKTGDTEVANNQNIAYTISYTYDASTDGPPLESISLIDQLPPQVDYFRSSGRATYDDIAHTVTWSLNDPTNSAARQFTLEVTPNTNDVFITNRITAATTASGGSGGNPGDSEFLSLVRGQGRNVGALGNKQQFTDAIISNGSGRADFASRRSQIEHIYDVSSTRNVNPVMVMVIWGVEQGFNANVTYPFGCLKETMSGFSANAECSAATLDFWMRDYEGKSPPVERASSTGNTCVYDDAFDYAYEYYTPVCVVNDANEHARNNFVEFYKLFVGSL